MSIIYDIPWYCQSKVIMMALGNNKVWSSSLHHNSHSSLNRFWRPFERVHDSSKPNERYTRKNHRTLINEASVNGIKQFSHVSNTKSRFASCFSAVENGQQLWWQINIHAFGGSQHLREKRWRTQWKQLQRFSWGLSYANRTLLNRKLCVGVFIISGIIKMETHNDFRPVQVVLIESWWEKSKQRTNR